MRKLIFVLLLATLTSCAEERDTLRINVICEDIIAFKTELVSKELYGTQPPTYSTQTSETEIAYMYGHHTFGLNTDDDFTLYTYFVSYGEARIQIELNDNLIVDTVYAMPVMVQDTLTVIQVVDNITYY